jgi:hypothetical protein
MNMRKILAGVVAGVLAATCVVSASATTIESTLKKPDSNGGANLATFQVASSSVMFNATNDIIYLITEDYNPADGQEGGVTRVADVSEFDVTKLVYENATDASYSDGGKLYVKRSLVPTMTVNTSEFSDWYSDGAGNIYKPQNSNIPTQFAPHDRPFPSYLKIMSFEMVVNYTNDIFDQTINMKNVLTWDEEGRLNDIVIDFSTIKDDAILRYGLIQDVTMTVKVLQVPTVDIDGDGVTGEADVQDMLTANQADYLTKLYGQSATWGGFGYGYGDMGEWDQPIVTGQEMKYYGSIDYNTMMSRTILGGAWFNYSGNEAYGDLSYSTPGWYFEVPEYDSYGRILISDVDVMRAAAESENGKAYITLDMSGEDAYPQHFIYAEATYKKYGYDDGRAWDTSDDVVARSRMVQANSKTITIELDPTTLADNDTIHYNYSDTAGVGFGFTRYISISIYGICNYAGLHQVGSIAPDSAINQIDGSEVRGIVVDGKLVIDDGVTAEPEETTNPAGEETSDTEPVEVDPDEPGEEIETEPEEIETEPEEIVTEPEDIETEPEEITTVVEETTTEAAATEPAAGDTDQPGNPKTGVALALIPALVAGAAVTIARKRK